MERPSGGRAGGGYRREAAITVAELGEFALIDAISERLPGGADLLLGPGDDAAVLRAPDGRVVATTDMMIEGRHFRREWSAPEDIGRRAAARNLSDLAAMGASPTGLLVAMALPGDLPVDWALGVVDGMADECGRAGAAVAGGDVSGAERVMLAVTALGDLAGRAPVTRSGARAGDQIAIAGTLGAAAAGLALLEAARAGRADPHSLREPALAALVRAYQRPQPDYQAGARAAALGATAMIDVSDGLLADLGHVARASGVRIDVRAGLAGAEPVADTEALRSAGLAARQPRWLDWVLTGGDDHALVATFPAETELSGPWNVIGAAGAGAGVMVDGRPWEGRGGWEHYRG